MVMGYWSVAILCLLRGSPAKNVYACSGKNDTWSISGNVIGSEAKIPAKCCWDERSDGSSFRQWQRRFFCHCKRSKIISVKVLTEVCSLENVASWNWRKSQWHGLIQCRWRWDRLFARGRHAEKVGNFYSLCLLHVPCNSVQKEIIK